MAYIQFQPNNEIVQIQKMLFKRYYSNQKKTIQNDGCLISVILENWRKKNYLKLFVNRIC